MVQEGQQEHISTTHGHDHDDYQYPTTTFDYHELATATGSFSPRNLIGRGSHGSVYKAFLLLHDHHHPTNPVAVKKPTSGHDNSRKLHNEIRTLSSFQPTHPTTSTQPYIVNFLGASHEYYCDENKESSRPRRSSSRLLVMEFLPNGSLEDLLHVRHHHVAPRHLSWSRRVEIIVRLAKGIEFLHRGCVIHRDLKPSNILFDSSWNPKIADFGLAVSWSRNDDVLLTTRTQPAGTIGYMDPSYAAPAGRVTAKVDVYSFGVVVLEIVSGRKAIDVARSPSSVVEWAMGLVGKGRGVEICDGRLAAAGELMELGAVGRLVDVAARCVAVDPDERPTMGEVVAGLLLLGGPAAGYGPVRGEYRVRVAGWVGLVRRSLKRVRKKRNNNNKLMEEECVKGGGHVAAVVKRDGQRDVSSKGKLLLWELLTDISLT